ncbi:MAG: GatB/YqeY domain-containing protein, partial [Prevotella sp.]
KLVKQGKDDAQLFKDNNRQSLADESIAQIKVMEEYLPKQMSEKDIEVKVKEIIADLGASSMQDMGKVMKEANKEMAGRAEGRIISGIVRKLLA